MINQKQMLAGTGLITDLDLADYWGRSGKTIHISTRRGPADFGVRIRIKDLLGALIEEGLATWDEPSGDWCYQTTADVPLGEIWILTATAANPQEQTTREAICVPLTLRWATKFKTAPCRESGTA